MINNPLNGFKKNSKKTANTLFLQLKNNLYLLLLNSPLCLRAFLTSLGDDTARERRVIAEVRPYILCFVSGGEGGSGGEEGASPPPPPGTDGRLL